MNAGEHAGVDVTTVVDVSTVVVVDVSTVVVVDVSTVVVVDVSTVVLVEGASDQRALEVLAGRLGRDLAAEGISVVAMGGATNFARFVEFFGPHGLDVGLAGLCDEREARVFQRGLERAGFGASIDRSQLEALRFFVCERDLEDELIRALGVATVERLLESQGDLTSFRTFQKQPDQRDKTNAARLRRFMGTRKGRKLQYASVLVEALDLEHVPAPLNDLITHI